LSQTWCKELEYPYRASNKKDFKIVYEQIINEEYEVKLVWFNQLKDYLSKNFSNKEKWINDLLYIYTI
jgi:hypothetical protein